MKIKIPREFQDYHLTDGQKIFAAVLQLCIHREGRNTEFFFHASDIRKMIGSKFQSFDNILFMPFIDRFDIGRYTDNIWSFQIKGKRYQHGPTWIWADLKGDYAKQLYYYLMGRLSPWDRTVKPHRGITDFEQQGTTLTHYVDDQLNIHADRELGN